MATPLDRAINAIENNQTDTKNSLDFIKREINSMNTVITQQQATITQQQATITQQQATITQQQGAITQLQRDVLQLQQVNALYKDECPHCGNYVDARFSAFKCCGDTWCTSL
ncbi:uncharacterized protein LOC129570906 [Sitodiplosis mosellana]|uniref:uncharacterized protein LOC129570906 n=1 Tax=Sitodiplosis mosellana TaxID=263140 RepID=UPI002443FD72|nr:uncharacterized protein LOC129570906 [Sitodiplosis mosellana]